MDNNYISDEFGTENYLINYINPFGAIARSLDLKKEYNKTTIRKLRKDVLNNHLLVIKDQGILSGDVQLKVTKWFGEVDNAGFEQHPKCPFPGVLRVSNDQSEGLQNFGVDGFHVDGSFMEMPNSYSLYHIIHAAKGADTHFISLNSLYNSVSPKKQSEWDQLWIVKKYMSVRNQPINPNILIHPLVYDHPTTGKKVMCFHLGKTHHFIYSFGVRGKEKHTTPEETLSILNDINNEIHKNNDSLIYKHKWEPGDFIISDNLSLAHIATPATQLPPEEIGLRVMHRTIVKGLSRPSKWVRHKQKKRDFCFCIKR